MAQTFQPTPTHAMAAQRGQPHAWACVLHSREHLSDCFLQFAPLPGVKLIAGMADLADGQRALSSIWIDARITWHLPGCSMFSFLQPQRDLQVCIYHCEHLAPEVCGLDKPPLRFLQGGLHRSMLVPFLKVTSGQEQENLIVSRY